MVKKRIITLGLVLGLAVNQVMLYQSRAISAEEYVIPQYLMDDIKKNVGTKNNVNSDNQMQNAQTINIDENVSQQPQSYQYSKQISIENNVNTQPVQVSNNNYNYEQANNYDPNRPEWSEFCPYQLENVTTKDDSFHLWGTNSRYSADFRNYWVDRKRDFENHLAQCDSVQDVNARYGCFAKLRERQYRITANYVDPWQQAAIRQQKFANWAQGMANVQNQINANAAAQREYELRRTEMALKYMTRAPQVNTYNNNQSTTYRFYNQYGQPTGYVKQSNW